MGVLRCLHTSMHVFYLTAMDSRWLVKNLCGFSAAVASPTFNSPPFPPSLPPFLPPLFSFSRPLLFPPFPFLLFVYLLPVCLCVCFLCGVFFFEQSLQICFKLYNSKDSNVHNAASVAIRQVVQALFDRLNVLAEKGELLLLSLSCILLLLLLTGCSFCTLLA